MGQRDRGRGLSGWTPEAHRGDGAIRGTVGSGSSSAGPAIRGQGSGGADEAVVPGDQLFARPGSQAPWTVSSRFDGGSDLMRSAWLRCDWACDAGPRAPRAERGCLCQRFVNKTGQAKPDAGERERTSARPCTLQRGPPRFTTVRLGRSRRAHNPEVAGSNPAPGTCVLSRVIGMGWICNCRFSSTFLGGRVGVRWVGSPCGGRC